LLFTISNYAYIFIHREAAPIGPPIFEWIIAKIFRKRIIYDFDDAIWIPNTSDQNKIAAVVKWHGKVSSIIKWSHKVSVGNAYLAEYARKYNRNVVINPTTIDTENGHNLVKDYSWLLNNIPVANHQKEADHDKVDLMRQAQMQNKEELTAPQPPASPSGSPETPSNESSKVYNRRSKTIIGWTGSHSTLPYINEIIPILQQLEQEYNVEFQVISNKDPELPLKHYSFIKWNKETEMEDLVKFDIGLMPLTEDKWAKGKCGFKALQYMALAIPALVSPVGVNTEIVQHGINGFICSTPEEWLKNIEALIENPLLRKTIGEKGRNTVLERYSVKSNGENFLKLFL
jgi:glycosyltransferase involved in cell wall biosynthesis